MTDLIELLDLKGRQLSAVVFVQDYLQLQFDGTTLTLTTWPFVHASRTVSYGQPCYRDELCSQIAKVVRVADVRPRDRLRLVFDDSSVLEVSLKDADRVDPEAVRLQEENGTWWVW